MALAGLLVAGLATPIGAVAVRALRPAGPTWEHVTSTLLPEYLAHTALLVALAGGLALVLGVGTAWLVAMCEFPGRTLFRRLLVLPLAVPAYMAAYTYAGMLDVTGPVQRLLRGLVPGAGESLFYWNVMRLETVAVILGLVLYPYIYLPTRSLLERRAGPALESARLLGSGARAVFFRVALPLARPAVAGGAALAVLEILNDYGAVQYYGVTTFTTGIFRAWFALGDLDAAVRLSAVLMLLALTVLLLERWQRGAARYHDVGPMRPVTPYRLRGGRAAAAVAFCTTPLLFGFVLPVGQLSYWAVRTAPEVVDASFLGMAGRSLLLAAVAGALAVGVAIALAYAARLDRTRWTRATSRLALLGYSIPGAVIAVGVLVTALWLGRALGGGLGVLLITGSAAGLVYGYVVRFMAVAYLPVEAGFDRVGHSPGAAARTLGASPLRALARVELPLARRAVLAASTLVVVDVLKELPLTLILRPFDFDTLATRAFQMAVDEQVPQSAPAALLVIGLACLAVYGIHRALDEEVAA